MSNIVKFWEFKNNSESESELMFYGPIASERPWWDESEMIVQNEFIKELNNQNGKNIKLRINSVGGDVFAAYAILTNLKLYKEKYNASITSQIEGLAASAATIVMTAGDIIKSPSYVNIMIHDPAMLLRGWYGGEDLQKAMNAWTSIKESIINAYSLRFSHTKEEITEIMKNETWYTGEQAKEMGFIDEIMFDIGSDEGTSVSNDNKYLFVAGVKHDISCFKNKPSFSNYIVGNQPVIKLDNMAVPINKSNQGGSEGMEIKNLEELRNAFPDLVKQATDAAREEGIKAERDRLKSIDEIANNLDSKMVNAAKYGDSIKNAQELAFEAIKNDSKNGTKYLENVAVDTKDSGVNNVAANPTNQESEQAALDSKDRVNAMVAGANNRRG